MTGGVDVRRRARALGCTIVGEIRRNWRLLTGAAMVAAALYWAIEVSDYQGRYDISAGYAVRMTCEADPESALWSGGCDRVAADIARIDKPSFLELYRAFVTVHHQQIPSPKARRQFADVACEPAFDQKSALRGTRYVFIPLRVHFAQACTPAYTQAVMQEIDARDRALLMIEREGLSHAALAAGALANLTEPVVIFVGAVAMAALLIL